MLHCSVVLQTFLADNAAPAASAELGDRANQITRPLQPDLAVRLTALASAAAASQQCLSCSHGLLVEPQAALEVDQLDVTRRCMGRKPNLSVEMLLAAENKITRLMGSTVSIRKGNAKDFRKALGKWCDQLCHLPVCRRFNVRQAGR